MKKNILSIINSNLRWFLLAMILANIAGEMLNSMLSLYLISLGASVAQVGLVYTVASLVPIVLQIFGGWMSDTVGRLRAIAIGSSITVFGYLIFFVSPSWQWVMIGLCVEFVSSSFVAPSFSAYVAEQCEEDVRGRVFGVIQGIYMVVTVIGPILGGILAYRVNFKAMLVVAFIFFLLATLLRIYMALSERFKPERAPEKPSFKGLKTQLVSIFGLLFAGGILTWIWVTDGLLDTSFNLTGQLFPIYLKDIGHLTVEQIGLFGAFFGGACILGNFLGGWLTDKWSERTILTGGFAILAASLVVMVTAHSTFGFFSSRVLMGLGNGILSPAYSSLISKVVPEEKRGLAFGFFGTSLGILSLPMPWIGGQLWETFSPQLPFWITAVACAFTVPVAWLKFKLPKASSATMTASDLPDAKS
jgi:MFS family permease